MVSTVSRGIFGWVWRGASHVDVITMSAIVQADLLIEELYFVLESGAMMCILVLSTVIFTIITAKGQRKPLANHGFSC